MVVPRDKSKTEQSVKECCLVIILQTNFYCVIILIGQNSGKHSRSKKNVPFCSKIPIADSNVFQSKTQTVALISFKSQFI